MVESDPDDDEGENKEVPEEVFDDVPIPPAIHGRTVQEGLSARAPVREESLARSDGITPPPGVVKMSSP